MRADIKKALVGLPGTGKTTTLMEVLNDELNAGTAPEDICASTFRKRMAGEFRSRAKNHVDDWPERDWMGTTHSLCYQLLEADEVVGAQEKADFCEQLGITCSASFAIADKADLAATGADGEKIGDLCFQARSYCLNTNLDPREDWRETPLSVQERSKVRSSPTSFEEFNREYERYKRENGLIDFNDMLLEVKNRGLVPPCSVLIEDEFQDKSPLQVDVFEMWADEIDRVYVAGDPYQAIYGFAGTEPAYMKEAAEAADERVVLDMSYRFGPGLWRFATRILERADYDPPEITPVGESDVEKITYDEYRHKVREHLDEECLHLFRCNYMADKATDVLEREGVPFSSPSGVRWTPALVDLYNGITKFANTVRATHEANEDSPLSVRYSLEHISAREALEMAKALRSTELQGTKKTIAETLRQAADPDNDEVQRRDVNLPSLFHHDWVLDTDNPFESSALIRSGAGGQNRDRLATAYRQFDGETVGEINHDVLTIHGSKGAEAENVFLFDGLSRTIKDEEGPWPFRSEEEARVFFVGATRAETKLYIVSYPEGPSFRFPEVPR